MGGVHESGEQGGGVGACRDGVRGDVGAQLGECECGGDEEDAGTVAAAAFTEEAF